jgi:YgiT-type zinc finger domain-containing protein
MLRTITVCPSCGSNTIKKVRRNWTGKVSGRTYIVPNLEYYLCPHCGEKVYDRQAMRKIEAHSPAFAKRPVEKKSA